MQQVTVFILLHCVLVLFSYSFSNSMETNCRFYSHINMSQLLFSSRFFCLFPWVCIQKEPLASVCTQDKVIALSFLM